MELTAPDWGPGLVPCLCGRPEGCFSWLPSAPPGTQAAQNGGMSSCCQTLRDTRPLGSRNEEPPLPRKGPCGVAPGGGQSGPRLEFQYQSPSKLGGLGLVTPPF